jgi:hypothetical protein
MRRVAALSAIAIVAMALPSRAGAHAVVFPERSGPRAYEKYVLRVPNERDVATTRIEIRFPRSVRIVSFADVPGWTLEVLRDSVKHVVGAVWTGSLQPARFVELPFVAVNPDSAVTLVWPVYQLYASGERIDWIGGLSAKQPAARTVVSRPRDGAALTLALWVCIGALVLSLVALALVLWPASRMGAIPPGA